MKINRNNNDSRAIRTKQTANPIKILPYKFVKPIFDYTFQSIHEYAELDWDQVSWSDVRLNLCTDVQEGACGVMLVQRAICCLNFISTLITPHVPNPPIRDRMYNESCKLIFFNHAIRHNWNIILLSKQFAEMQQ